jgi:hypoxanthine-DNA glycosylase
MIETHPFGNFVPADAKYLILGSFTGKEAVKGAPETDDAYDWFYGTKKNQFWPILKKVYNRELKDISAKQQLFTKLGIAITDIIVQCERKNDSNLDNNLINIAYNEEPIFQILKSHKIKKILFTSRFVEKKFKVVFKDIVENFSCIQYATLPSPSPRYALMSKEEKIQKYKELLPKM